MWISESRQRRFPDDQTLTRPNERLETSDVNDVRMFPERRIDSVQKSGRGTPVDGVIHFDAFVDLAEEFVDASNDCRQCWT